MSSAERHSQLDIGILGPLEVRVAGHPVPLGGRRQRAVLALLLLHANEVVSCDRLIDDLWHGQPPDSALSVLRTYVSHLRKALHAGEAWQDQPLKTRSPGYVFQLGAEDLDAARFERLLERGRALLAGGDAATASSSLHEGLHLWRGPALGEFANTDFAQPEAVRLEELRLAAIEECFEADLALGRHAEVASRGDSLLRQQPLRERLAGQLMLALYRSGRQAEALSVYGRIREALLEDLGIEPGAQLQALQQAILLQRPELDWRPPEEAAEADRAPPAPGSERSAAQWNVPARNAAFTGRLRLLRYMRTVLESAQSTTGVRVAVLHGLGGVGKTQLATEYLHRHADDYLLGWWIPAQEPLTLLGALADLAAALGVSTEAEQRRVLTSLWAELRQRDRWILVYDNAEDPEALRGFVPPAGHGHVLITSRNPGWGAFGRGIAVDVLHRREAVAFLDRRCGVQKGSAVLAEELGDLPLALEQAAAYCEQTGLDLGEYVSLFRSRREALLARGEPADYGGTVRATWRLAFEQLEMRSPAAGQLLRLLAFLAPEAVPFELLREHAASLPSELGSAAADELAFHDAVAALLRFSLVDRGPSGLRLHRLVQMVMRAELAPAERAAWAARAVELLSEAVPSDPTDPSAWPRWRQLAPHVSAATAHAQALEVAERPAADLLHLVGVSLHCQAKLSSARTFLERALALRRALHGDDHPAVGDTLSSLGNVRQDAGDFSGAREALERALRIFRAQPRPDEARVALALRDLGDVLHCRGELSAAQACQEQAITLLERALGPRHREVARALTDLGHTLWAAARLPEASAAFERALELLQPDHDDPERARALAGSGMVRQDLGDLADARDRYEQALALYERAYGPDHPTVGYTHDKLGYLLRLLGDLHAARVAHERALGVLERAYGPEHLEAGMPLTNLGLVLDDLGQPAEAAVLQRRALATFERAYGADHPTTQLASRRLALVLAHLGERPEAKRRLLHALEIARRSFGDAHPEVSRVAAELETVRTGGPRDSEYWGESCSASNS